MTVNIGLGDLARLRDIAERAGKEILKVYGGDFDVEVKADASPVTAADKRSEALITEEIKAMTDAFHIVGEEAFADGRIPDVAGRPFWLVDPLDGTKEFIKRNGEFTVNIALVEGGRPVVGIVHAPALDATYWGSRDGAFATIGGGEARPITARSAPADGLVALVSRSHRTPEVDEFLAAYTIKKAIGAGSSLKFCPGGGGTGGSLSAPGTNHGMGHRRRARRTGLCRRSRKDSRRRGSGLRKGGIREPAFRRHRTRFRRRRRLTAGPLGRTLFLVLKAP